MKCNAEHQRFRKKAVIQIQRNSDQSSKKIGSDCHEIIEVAPDPGIRVSIPFTLKNISVKQIWINGQKNINEQRNARKHNHHIRMLQEEIMPEAHLTLNPEYAGHDWQKPEKEQKIFFLRG